jgi:hypothetical protein
MCICHFPAECGGLGVLLCMGCGGDQCVCECGGEVECWGCPQCATVDESRFDDDE